MTIATTADGTRFRVSVEPLTAAPKNLRTFVWADGHICEYGDLDFGTDHQPVHQAHCLPAIPDWPLPGTPPQYLHHGGDIEVQDGDAWVFKAHLAGSWSILEGTNGGGTMSTRTRDADCWLIARLNPSEDA